jgi:hypothetical protein
MPGQLLAQLRLGPLLVLHQEVELRVKGLRTPA